MKKDELYVEKLGRGYAWFDTGTCEALLEAAQFVQILEHRQGTQIGCIEEIAWRCNFISNVELEELVATYPNSRYKSYLSRLGEHA